MDPVEKEYSNDPRCEECHRDTRALDGMTMESCLQVMVSLNKSRTSSVFHQIYFKDPDEVQNEENADNQYSKSTQDPEGPSKEHD
jgi:hypothetical protein